MKNKNVKSELKRYTALDGAYAAISMALYECDENNIHDKETNMVTIDSSRQNGSWSSKILTLRHAPKR